MKSKRTASAWGSWRLYRNSAVLAALMLLSYQRGFAQTTVPPTAPYGLTATAASCGQVDLSWSAATDNSGTGLKAYTIWRNDSGLNTVTAIGAVRTTFSDTIYVQSSTTQSYYVVAQDKAGNKSVPSNTVTVNTPACPMASGEQIADSAYSGPLGKSMATYGARTALIYQKLNLSNRDTWLYVNDSDSGQSSHFLLHSYPGYSQVETDYVLTSATDLWTLSYNSGTLGHLLVSHYRLNGSPVSSATLLSTQPLGGSLSVGLSIIHLQSGALVAGWTDFPQGISSTGNLIAGYAYFTAGGTWIVHTPVTLATNIAIRKGRLVLAQHPADGSVWMFMKQDSQTTIMALHFTEISNDLHFDSLNSSFISQAVDGPNGPEGEFPYLAATPDPTRNAILLAYQNQHYQFVFIDPLYGNLSNNIFLKQALVSVAQVAADGSKTFISFPNYIERITPFGMSVLSDGRIWLTYQPVSDASYTWNQVYTSHYQSANWSAPVLAGLDYNDYNNANGLDISLVYRADQPQVAFRTPDQEIHTFDLSNLGPAPADTTVPTTSITGPSGGATVSGSVTIAASASDNVGVTRVELWLDGSPVATATTASYSFVWNTTTAVNGTHILQTKAYDAAGNVGLSASVSVSVNNPISSANLTVAITNPINGGIVPRNQKVTISAAASDNATITRVQFYVDNSLLGTASTAPYAYPWKVPGKKGTHNIKAQAYDAMGNSAAQAITVTAQ